jgi:AraC family transcriptional regulator
MAARALVTGEFYGEQQRQQCCGGIVLSELKHRRKKALPEHTHEAAYICLLLSGDYREVFGTRSIEYAPMSAVLHPPAFTHHDFIGGTGGHFLTVELRNDWLASVYKLSPRLVLEPSPLNGEAAQLVRRLDIERRLSDPWSALMIEGTVLEILATVARAGHSSERRTPTWIPRIHEIFRENLAENLSINQLAVELDIDPIHLGRTYRRCTGESFAHTRQRMRLEFVCSQLQKTELPLIEVASIAGFSDQSHMTRVFRRAFGLTPGEYRRLHTRFRRAA